MARLATWLASCRYEVKEEDREPGQTGARWEVFCRDREEAQLIADLWLTMGYPKDAVLIEPCANA